MTDSDRKQQWLQYDDQLANPYFQSLSIFFLNHELLNCLLRSSYLNYSETTLNVYLERSAPSRYLFVLVCVLGRSLFWTEYQYVNGLVQDCSISIANDLDILIYAGKVKPSGTDIVIFRTDEVNSNTMFIDVLE